MDVVRLIAAVLNVLLLLYMAVLVIRLILEWIPMFQRSWRPRGVMLVVAEVVFTVTDPPIRFIRRFVPPLRIGGMGIDFAFPITFLACSLLLGVTRALAA